MRSRQGGAGSIRTTLLLALKARDRVNRGVVVSSSNCWSPFRPEAQRPTLERKSRLSDFGASRSIRLGGNLSMACGWEEKLAQFLFTTVSGNYARESLPKKARYRSGFDRLCCFFARRLGCRAVVSVAGDAEALHLRQQRGALEA